MEKNLTTGGVLKNVVSFSLPFLLSYFLQTLYGMADLFIIGQYEGVASTTAVSVGSQIMHMLTVMIVGLAMGTTVTIGRAVGAGDREKTAKGIGNTVTLFMGLSVVLTLLLFFLSGGIVSLVQTPEQAADGTIKYLKVCFLGIPFITAYNIIAAIYRGIGDSKSPMYFVTVACAANIGLDYFFMGALKMGPVGAALGTTLSQGISVVISLIFILKKKTDLPIKRAHFRPDREVMGEILRIGVPVTLQDGFIQVAFMVVTVIANRRGLTDAAAVVQFFAEPIVSLFTSDAGVITAGGQYYRGYVWDSCIGSIQFSFSGYFCACGRSELSFLHNIISIITVRVPGAFLASRFFADTLLPMGFASSAGSLVSSVVCVAAFLIITRNGRSPLKTPKEATV